MSARLFAGLELPAPVRARLAQFGAAAAAADDALRPVDEASLHLTLAFLGERPAGDVSLAGEAVARLGGAAPRLELGEPLWLSPRRPHVLAVAIVDPLGALARLQQLAVGALAAELEDWSPGRRAFRAHVTVARVRGGRRPRMLLPDPPRGRFSARAVVLWRSRTGGGGSRYEPLARAALS